MRGVTRITGIDETINRLQGLEKDLRRRIIKLAGHKGAGVFYRGMIAEVPVEHGDLRKSIKIDSSLTKSRNAISFRIGSDNHVAYFVEYGHKLTKVKRVSISKRKPWKVKREKTLVGKGKVKPNRFGMRAFKRNKELAIRLVKESIRSQVSSKYPSASGKV